MTQTRAMNLANKHYWTKRDAEAAQEALYALKRWDLKVKIVGNYYYYKRRFRAVTYQKVADDLLVSQSYVSKALKVYPFCKFVFWAESITFTQAYERVKKK